MNLLNVDTPVYYIFREGVLDLLGIFLDKGEAERELEKYSSDPGVHLWDSSLREGASCVLDKYACYVGQEEEASQYSRYFNGGYTDEEVPF